MKNINKIFRTPTKNNKSGFTLVELVVVIAILAIIAAIAIPTIGYTMRSAKVSATTSAANVIEESIKSAQAAEVSENTHMYANALTGITVKDVIEVNAIADAFEPVEMAGVTYYPVWCEGGAFFVDLATHQSIDGVDVSEPYHQLSADDETDVMELK